MCAKKGLMIKFLFCCLRSFLGCNDSISQIRFAISVETFVLRKKENVNVLVVMTVKCQGKQIILEANLENTFIYIHVMFIDKKAQCF